MGMTVVWKQIKNIYIKLTKMFKRQIFFSFKNYLYNSQTKYV